MELSKPELLSLLDRIASEDKKSISLNRSYRSARELTIIFVYVIFINRLKSLNHNSLGFLSYKELFGSRGWLQDEWT